MAQPYDRTRYYLEMGDFVKIMGMEGISAFFKIALVEPMAQQTVLFADAIQGADVPGQPTDPQPQEFGFTEPVQEMRLIQVRTTIYAITVTPGTRPDMDHLPPTIEVKFNSPKTSRRGGTDKRTTVTMNGFANIVGGREGGRMPANQIRRLSDPNEVFDLWIMYGYDPAFNILNGSVAPLGGGLGGVFDFTWDIANQGRRYVLSLPTEEELKGLISRFIPYRAITLGGIDTVTEES